MTQQYSEFIKKVKRVHDKRNSTIKNSYGVRDYFNHYRKLKPSGKKYVLTDCQYYSILRAINRRIRDDFALNGEIVLPNGFGKIYCATFEHGARYDSNGKLRIDYTVDWDSTLKLWASDDEALKNKTLVRNTAKTGIKAVWEKSNIVIRNRSYYEFRLRRDLYGVIRENFLKGKLKLIYR